MRVSLATACVMTCAITAGMGAARAATLTTLTSFTSGSTSVSNPQAGLIMDASGNLYGTSLSGGTSGVGTVFELAKTGSSYTLKTLVNFDRTINRTGFGGLYQDASGSIYGTTAYGGAAYGDGNVFKLTPSGSNFTLSTLANFTGSNGSSPASALIADKQGNLYGTTVGGGANGWGTVFELVKNGSSYTVSTLASFSSATGGDPFGALVMDGSGNLFGTTNVGGPSGQNGPGTVFELVKGTTGYTLTTLVAFNITNGSNPYAGLISDISGNLFGTTPYGGANHAGTVFELVKGATGYTLLTLFAFNITNGATPDGALIEDSDGNLFGTTLEGGASGKGTAFKLVKGANGYTLVTLATFTGANGASPYDALIADHSGNLFGTTSAGGANSKGTVFEITDSGFVVPTAVPEPPSWALLAGAMLATAAWRRRKAA